MTRKPYQLLIAVMMLLIAASCKKNDTSSPQPTIDSNAVLLNPHPILYNSDSIWGVFEKSTFVTIRYDYHTGITSGPDSNLDVRLAIADTEFRSTRAVKYNGMVLDTTGTPKTYYERVKLNYSMGDVLPSVWNISGLGDIPDFTFTDTLALPDYTGPIPRTIDRTKNYTLHLGSNMVHADFIQLEIVAGADSIVEAYPKDDSITLTPAYFTSIPAGHVVLYVGLLREQKMKINNRYYLSVVTRTYQYDAIIN